MSTTRHASWSEVCGLIAWSVLGVGGVMPVAGAEAPPNVVLIMADDFGYECVAANGGNYRTPHLDQLAKTGVRFERCYVQPLCTPTRVQLMTGLYNQRNYVQFGLLPANQKTFGNWFQKAGYATGVFGKWQLGGGFEGPEHFGFGDYCLWQLTRRPPRYANPGLEFEGTTHDYSQGEYGPDLVSDALCRFIETNKAKPFFAYYPMIITHDPFEPTPDSPDYRKSAKGPEGDRSRVAAAKYFPDMVSYADKLVGKVVAKLEALGLRERTLIVFLGDNGTGKGITSEWNGKPYKGGKGSHTESGMHVPLIVNWPGKIAGGRVATHLVDSTDFVPTLLDAARLARPTEVVLDGHSLWPYLEGKAFTPRSHIYSWYARGGGTTGSEFVRGPKLKLYRDGKIFDVLADPDENRPLKSTELAATDAAELESLQTALRRFDGTRPAWTFEKKGSEAGDATGKKAKKAKKAKPVGQVFQPAGETRSRDSAV